MPATDATLIGINTIWQTTGPTQELFPAVCLKANGDLIRMSRVATSHVATDGNLVSATSSDGGVNWSAQSTILDKATDLRAAIPRRLSNGKIMVALWEAISGSPMTYKTYTMLSTSSAATAWDAPVQLPNQTGKVGNACESPVVVMPGGDLLLPVYESESASGSTGWSAALYKSTDGGASWAFLTYIARSADSVSPPQANYEEPFLLRLANGELLCSIRQSETGWTAGTLRYTHLWRSTDNGLTWTDEGRVYSGAMSASRASMFQTSDGAVFMQFRLLNGSGTSMQGVFLVSADNGHTWSTPRNLDTGVVTPGPAAPPVYSYGDFIQLSNTLISAIFVDETPISGSGPAIRFGTYALTLGAPPAVAVGFTGAPTRRPKGRRIPA